MISTQNAAAAGGDGWRWVAAAGGGGGDGGAYITLTILTLPSLPPSLISNTSARALNISWKR